MSVYSINNKEPIAAWIPSLDSVGNGTTTLTDLVGSNNGTLINMDIGSDWISDTTFGGVRALHFDGIDDHVSIPNVLTTGDITLSMFLRPESLALSVIFADYDSDDPNLGFGVGLSITASGKLDIWTSNGWFPERAWRSSGNTALIINNWVHFVITMTGTTSFTTYINGVSVGTFTASQRGNNTGTCFFGSDPLQTAPFTGRLDDIRIWNQALNSADVLDLYNAGRGGVVPTSYLSAIAMWMGI